MSNHLHLVAQADTGFHLSDILRDLKKFTSKKIVQLITEIPESRSEWILYRFAYSGKFDPKIKDYRFWQEGNEAKLCYSAPFLKQKIDYVHNNPVRAQLVAEPQHYLHSSAIDYCGITGFVDVVPVVLFRHSFVALPDLQSGSRWSGIFNPYTFMRIVNPLPYTIRIANPEELSEKAKEKVWLCQTFSFAFSDLQSEYYSKGFIILKQSVQ